MSSRKRARPNPANQSTQSTQNSAQKRPPNSDQNSTENSGVASPRPDTSSLTRSGTPSIQPDQPDPRPAAVTIAARNDKRVRKTSSWYGSWPRVSKSSASTQVARENIMGNTPRSAAPADFSRFEITKREPSTDSDRQSTGTSLAMAPATANATTSEPSKGQADQDRSGPCIEQPATPSAGDGTGDATTVTGAAPAGEGEDEGKPHPSAGQPSQVPAGSSSWLSWLSRSTVEKQTEPANNQPDTHPAVPVTEIETEMETTEPPQLPSAPAQPPPEPPKPTQPTTSWFGLWSSSASAATPSNTNQEPAEEQTIVEEPEAKNGEDVVMQDATPSSAPAPASVSTATTTTTTTQPSAGSTWAFWSRDTTLRKGRENASSTEQGELAVMGDGSETSPRRSSMEVKAKAESSNKKELPIKSVQERIPETSPNKKAKRNRPHSVDLDERSTARPSTSGSDVTTKNQPSTSTTSPAQAQAQAQAAPPPNLLLPSFQNTYSMKENSSIIQQITRLLLRTQQSPTKHVFLSKDTPSVKKAIAIGVHGLFPATYLRPMVGQPTGTSIRFANYCAEAIRRWADTKGSGGCEIEKVALEGDGKIADRVNNLWKLLLNWIEHIKNADLIMLACHSQGVPVGVMLLAKLIDLGVITNSRIGVCAMAGVSLGPFPDYKSGMGMWMGSAAELWQFADPGSEISKRYEHALKTVVEYGARITYVGSIDDQLVPLQSALYGPACHPYLYRAVFIDGRIHAPDFIAHLVGFALKLRNLGISDHGLIRELSVPLAGSLYSGEGHSRLYDDGQVYDLAVSHALETTSAPGVPCEIQQHQGLASPNPYVLPWIMRGLLEEEFVKTELSLETAELLKQFDDWSPTTKALKDVKYRLEAVRSKLY
ncbi:hypothetical protein F4777DRAFT_529488 [Nemania sp. FL0916]|nr:hypothetical protein F4777DRAFT_529488 [Nemania sp. FL0916]